MADEATPTETVATDTVEATDTATTIDGADQAVETTVADTQAETAQVDAETTTDADKSEKVETFDRDYVEKLRREAQTLRKKAKEDAEKASKEAAEAAEKALTERLGKALGFIQDDKPVDPQTLLEQAAEREAQIANERDAYRAQIQAFQLDQALTKAANAADGDLDILVPFLRGTGALDKLDPTADDYTDQVSAVVAHAVESNPKLRKAAPVAAPTRSGGDIANGAGAPPRTKNPTDIDGWRKKLFGDN
ncbi:hypothetical protein ICV35_23905 [Rhodococcus ruber]|uniref:hypothetical protein n=1 Tax=Rhodococcus ruber TaxID=1830 RepID=UPI0017826761|nr:hypothetical protein [Rhodococcus ruber]MBD8056697.1 hypothetical protein [Rhodococcus ruber]